MAQQARNLVWELDEREENRISFLIHDRDRKFCGEFNRVFESEGVEIVLTPPRAPQANSIAERWVRSAREECLDQILILNERHLLSVMKDFTRYHNHERPHQGLNQRIPLGTGPPIKEGSIQRRDVLGGVIHSYYRQSA